MSTNSQAGIVSAILGNIILNLALNLQKRAKIRLVRLALHGIPHHPSKKDYQKLLALALLIVGQCSNFVAYGLAPASIVSPLGVLAVISNCIVPPLLFDETPSIHNITGTTIALPGILLLIFSAPSSIDEFIYPLEPPTRLYIGLLCAIVAVCCTVRSSTNRADIRLYTDCLVSSVMGSFCVLSIKCACAIVRSQTQTLGHVLLFLAVAIVVTGILQLVIVTQIIGSYPVWIVVPRLFVFLTVFVGLGSAIVFHEFRDSGLIARLEFVSGCTLVCLGTLISAKPKKTVLPAPIMVKRSGALGPPKTRRRRNKNARKRAKRQERQRIRRLLDQEARGPTSRRRRPRSKPNLSNPSSGLFDPIGYSRPTKGHTRFQSVPYMHSSPQFGLVSRSLPLQQREYIIPTRSRPNSRSSMFAIDLEDETSLLLVPRRYSGPMHYGSRGQV